MQVPHAGPDPVPLTGPEITFHTLGLLARPAFTSTLCLPLTCGLHHSGCEAHFWLATYDFHLFGPISRLSLLANHPLTTVGGILVSLNPSSLLPTWQDSAWTCYHPKVCSGVN